MVVLSPLVVYTVVTEEYERLKIIFERDDYQLDDLVLHQLLTKVYENALLEYNVPFRQCNVCSVIATKYNQLSNDVKTEYENDYSYYLLLSEKYIIYYQPGSLKSNSRIIGIYNTKWYSHLSRKTWFVSMLHIDTFLLRHDTTSLDMRTHLFTILNHEYTQIDEDMV